MCTQDIVHSFFYDTSSFSKNYLRTSYNTWSWLKQYGIISEYRSYSTVIAVRRYDKKKQEVLVISDHKYSMTTSRHLRELEMACPHYRIYYVPHCENAESMDKLFTDRLNGIKEHTLDYFKTKANRDAIERLIYMFDKYDEDVEHCPKASKVRKSKFIKQIVDMLSKDRKGINSFVANYEAEQKKQRARERASELRAKRKELKLANEILAKNKITSDYDKIFFLFAGRFKTTMDSNERHALTTYVNMMCNGDTHDSFIWEQDDYIKTSMGIEVSTDIVKQLLTRFVKNQKLVGEPCDRYTILKHTADHIKVGCHNIPIWNVNALCQHFNITA